jgi:hypothetical protein
MDRFAQWQYGCSVRRLKWRDRLDRSDIALWPSKSDDGYEFVFRAGDVSVLPSRCDAWVEGNEPAVVVDFQGMAGYAEKR